MTDRIALVAGVGGATGAALSRRFARGGYRVAMIARNAERLAELETQIPRARGYPCDVANLDRLGEIVERVQTELGAPHVLIHNAVAATFAKILDASVEDLERNFQVNTTSLFFLVQKLAPAMIDRGEGAIMVTGTCLCADQGRPAHPGPVPGKGFGPEARACWIHHHRCRDRRPVEERHLAAPGLARQAGRLFRASRRDCRRGLPHRASTPLHLVVRSRHPAFR